jgi:hypothetical protein
MAQRDMDLIRSILLLQTEQHQDPIRPFVPSPEGHSEEVIAYHVKLLAEAGLIEATTFSHSEEWTGDRSHVTFQCTMRRVPTSITTKT